MLEVCINFHVARAKKYAKMCKSLLEINITKNVIILYKTAFFSKENTCFR